MSRFGIIRLLSGAFALSIKVGTLIANRQIILPPDAPTGGQSIRAKNSDPEQLEWYTPTSGGVGEIAFSASPVGIFDVSGSPGSSINLSLDSQPANAIFAGPSSGGIATPSFRILVPNDLPDLNATKITAGVFDIARLPVGNTLGTIAAGNDSRFHNQNTDLGTTSATFQIQGVTGVVLKNASGSLNVRNSTDSGWSDVTASNFILANGQTLERLYRASFTSANITSNLLTVTHNLGQQYVKWHVYDQNGKDVTPDATASSASVLTLDFEGLTVTGTWNVVVGG